VESVLCLKTKVEISLENLLIIALTADISSITAARISAIKVGERSNAHHRNISGAVSGSVSHPTSSITMAQCKRSFNAGEGSLQNPVACKRKLNASTHQGFMAPVLHVSGCGSDGCNFLRGRYTSMRWHHGKPLCQKELADGPDGCDVPVVLYFRDLHARAVVRNTCTPTTPSISIQRILECRHLDGRIPLQGMSTSVCASQGPKT